MIKHKNLAFLHNILHQIFVYSGNVLIYVSNKIELAHGKYLSQELIIMLTLWSLRVKTEPFWAAPLFDL